MAPIPHEPVRVALLTPPGRGALAVVGVAGAKACDLADGLFQPRRGPPLAARPDRSIAVGTWQSLAGSPGEELVVVRHSADRLEVHCHGGTAAAAAVLESLVAAGAVREPWPAWLAGAGGSEIDVEARQALAAAAGPRAARILSRQLAGALAAEFARIGSLPEADRHDAVARLVRAARVGLRLTEPWRVVVAGRVNAGKSSLVNALAGHARSIVSPEPGTTRDLVTTRIVLDGWEVELVDTAGERGVDAVASPTERAGIARATEARGQADLVLLVVPAGEAVPEPGPGELVVITKADLGMVSGSAGGGRSCSDEVGPGLQSGQSGLFEHRLRSSLDAIGRLQACPTLEATNAPNGSAYLAAGGVVTSAVTGRGIDELAARIVAALVPEDRGEPGLLDGPVPFTPRQVDALRGPVTP